MTISKKISLSILAVAIVAVFFAFAQPTHAGFFDWLFGNSVKQEANVMRAVDTQTTINNEQPFVAKKDQTYTWKRECLDGTDITVTGVPVGTTPDASYWCKKGGGTWLVGVGGQEEDGNTVPVGVVSPAVPLGETLRFGTQSRSAALLQERLKAIGFYNGAITGKIDAATQAAVAAFQRSKGLTADGVAGTNTINVLNNTDSVTTITATTATTAVKPTVAGEKHYHLTNQRIVTQPITASSTATSRIHTTVSCANNERVMGGGYNVDLNANWKVMASYPVSSQAWKVILYPGVSGDSLASMASSMNMSQLNALNHLLQETGNADVYAVCAEVEYSSGGSTNHF